jgi:hypothetical protein
MPYIKVDNDFITTDKLTWPEKRIYMVLQMYAGADGRCFPSYETIAAAAGLKKRQVMYLVKSLSEKGWLSIERRKDANGQHSNSYVLMDLLAPVGESSALQTVRDRFWYGRIMSEEPEKSLEVDVVYKVLEVLLERNVSTLIGKESFSAEKVRSIVNALTYEEIRGVVFRYYSNRYSVKNHVSYLSALLLKAHDLMSAEDEIRQMYDQAGSGADSDLDELRRISEKGRKGW